MEESFEIPEELMILNPEMQKKAVVIGKKAYWLYPLTEGVCEKFALEVGQILGPIFTLDCSCDKCHKVHSGVLGKKIECDCGGSLTSLQKSPMTVLLEEGRIAKLAGEILNIPPQIIRKEATLAQIRHLAAVLWKQNFDERSTVPEESIKNFQSFLEWMGVSQNLQEAPKMEGKEEELVLEDSMRNLQQSMDGQESISKEDGEKED